MFNFTRTCIHTCKRFKIALVKFKRKKQAKQESYPLGQDTKIFSIFYSSLEKEFWSWLLIFQQRWLQCSNWNAIHRNVFSVDIKN